MYAQLGNIKFEGQKGFTSFSHERGVNFAQHERIQGKPRLQSVGDNLDTVSFDMYLHSEFTDPESDIDLLSVNMNNKEVLLLLLGNGKIVGDFVITNFSQQTLFTDPVGNLISATVSISLLEVFSDDKLREAEKKAIADAFATQIRNSNVRTVLPPKLSQGMGLTANVGKLQMNSTLITQQVVMAESNSSFFDLASEVITETCDILEGIIAKIDTTLHDFPFLDDMVPDLGTVLNDVYVRIQDVRSVMPISDIANVRVLTNELAKSTSLAKKANVNISNNSIIRRI